LSRTVANTVTMFVSTKIFDGSWPYSGTPDVNTSSIDSVNEIVRANLCGHPSVRFSAIRFMSKQTTTQQLFRLSGLIVPQFNSVAGHQIRSATAAVR